MWGASFPTHVLPLSRSSGSGHRAKRDPEHRLAARSSTKAYNWYISRVLESKRCCWDRDCSQLQAVWYTPACDDGPGCVSVVPNMTARRRFLRAVLAPLGMYRQEQWSTISGALARKSACNVHESKLSPRRMSVRDNFRSGRPTPTRSFYSLPTRQISDRSLGHGALPPTSHTRTTESPFNE